MKEYLEQMIAELKQAEKENKDSSMSLVFFFAASELKRALNHLNKIENEKS